MWKKPVALRQVRERPAVERQGRREKAEIAKRNFPSIGSLDPCETRQNRALPGTGRSEQSEALTRPQTDANVNREGASRFDYVRIKHRRCALARANVSA